MASAAPGSDEVAADGRRRGSGERTALWLALAALLSCWNPLAAPLGLAVGLGAMALAAVRLRRPRGSRRTAALGLGIGALAAVVSAVVLWRSASAVSAELTGEPVLEGRRTAAEAGALLDQAAARTAEARDRARRELSGGAAESGAGTPRSARSGDGLPP